MSLSLTINLKRVEGSGTYPYLSISPTYTSEEHKYNIVKIVDVSSYTFNGGENITAFFSLDDVTLTETNSDGDVIESITKLMILDGDKSTSSFTAATSATDEITAYIFTS